MLGYFIGFLDKTLLSTFMGLVSITFFIYVKNGYQYIRLVSITYFIDVKKLYINIYFIYCSNFKVSKSWIEYTGCLLISETYIFCAGGHKNGRRKLKIDRKVAKCHTLQHVKFHQNRTIFY